MDAELWLEKIVVAPEGPVAVANAMDGIVFEPLRPSTLNPSRDRHSKYTPLTLHRAAHVPLTHMQPASSPFRLMLNTPMLSNRDPVNLKQHSGFSIYHSMAYIHLPKLKLFNEELFETVPLWGHTLCLWQMEVDK